MANKTFQGRIVQKHDTEANWKKATNFVPLKGELIIYDDLNKIKIGDGTTKVNDLKFDTATFYVNVTQGTDNSATADKTAKEIYDAYQAGYAINAIAQFDDIDYSYILPLAAINENNGIIIIGFGALGSTSLLAAPQYPTVCYNGNQWQMWIGTLIRNGDLAQVAKTGSYNDLANKPTIPSIGNGTLTIQKNSTTIDTFTANATTNKTINIEVPTKISDLTDDVVSGKYLPLTGGTMTGNININNKTITNLKTPTASTEAANKKYVDDQIAANDHIVNRFTFTATAGQSTFTVPFDFEDSSALTLYYNGVMMKETDNYTVSGKVITLAGFAAEADDYLTVMGIEGAAAIDYGKEAENAIKQINATKESATTEINTVKANAIKDINDLVANLPSDTASLMFINKTNTMAANGKITMASTYSPSDSGDIATKKYVDDSKPSIVGTATTFPIYIGSSTPASGTAPLLWIDTSSSGTFKYRTSKTGTWTIVPVAWS